MNQLVKRLLLILLLPVLCPFACYQLEQSWHPVQSPLNEAAAYGLIKRILPKHAQYFEVAYIPQDSGKDVFELESRGNTIILRGNNGVSVAGALNYYLKYIAHCDISWNGTNLNIPDPMPAVPQKIRKHTPYKYRYYFNYTTYTTLFWDWDRWQWEIDWMALNGINMPLAVAGQNSIWDRVYKSLGFTDKDMDAFFSGPAYFIWFWMGNLDGWGGPLPKSWLKNAEELQKKILARERELGMTPVLQAFTGHVPPNFKNKFPSAQLRKTNWEGRFADTYILDPADSMFTAIGKKFLTEQNKTYGTDHYYAADIFNEMVPPSNDSMFLNDINKVVYRSMSAADSQAVWVMQGWLFVDKEAFWQPTQIKAALNAVPDNRMIILDLFSDLRPVWNRTEAYYGKPWIWCMLHNFGERISLFGDMDKIANLPSQTFHDPKAGQMKGLGVVPEGLEQNPVMYALMLENVWRDSPVEVNSWLKAYAHRRYGKENTHADSAWQILKRVVYNNQAPGQESIITGRPTFSKSTEWTYTEIFYRPGDLLPAWEHLLAAAPELQQSDGFQYDLVDVTRQVLANYATIVQQQFAKDHQRNDLDAFNTHSRRFLELIDDLDRLLATRKDFLLGRWLTTARNRGATPAEKDLYEKNARDLITLWGDKDCVLHEYAVKQWSGLLTGFYKKRWEQFFRHVTTAMEQHRPPDLKAFENQVKEWEWQWVNSHEPYTDQPRGNPVAVAREMHAKYAALLQETYRNPELNKAER